MTRVLRLRVQSRALEAPHKPGNHPYHELVETSGLAEALLQMIGILQHDFVLQSGTPLLLALGRADLDFGIEIVEVEDDAHLQRGVSTGVEGGRQARPGQALERSIAARRARHRPPANPPAAWPR